MVEVLVWLLLVSPSTSKSGPPQTLERFKTQHQCEHVRTAMPPTEGRSRYFYTKCVQANILVPKGNP